MTSIVQAPGASPPMVVAMVPRPGRADDRVGGQEAAAAARLGVVQVGVEAHGVGDHAAVELGNRDLGGSRKVAAVLDARVFGQELMQRWHAAREPGQADAERP